MRRGYLMSICRRMPITRQSFFLPTQISNCSLWLDAADTSSDSMILSGSNVSTWKDKSGTGNNATANTGTVTTNSTKLNGLNTIRFAGSSFLNIASFTMTANISVFAVLRGVGAQGSGNAGYFFLGNGAHPSFFVYTLQPQYTNLAGPYSAWVASTGETNWYMPSSDFFLNNPGFIYTDNSASYVNGSQLTFNPNRASVPNTVSAGAYSIQVGGRVQSDSLAFDFAECIFFNRTITSTERQQIEGYLAQKWGLTASLPAGHPGLTSLLYRLQQPFLAKKQYFTAFSPRQIPGLGLWLDGADSSSITTVTGVSQWNDKSGNGYNLTQGSTGSQPTRTGNLLNFVSNYNMNIPQAAINNASTWSMFFLVNPIASVNWFMAKQRDGVNSYNIFSTTQTGGPGPNAYFTGLTNYLYVRMFNAGTLAASSAALTMSQLQILSFVYDGTNMLIYINGNLSSTTAGSFAIQNDTSSTNFLLGQWFGNGTNYNSNGNFQLGELIYFNTAITATNRQQVESYLAQKWGLVSYLPATNHIHNTFPAGSPTAIQAFIPSIRPAVLSIPFIGGGSSSSSGVFSIRTFLTTGQLILSKSISATILVVGGGGGGGSAGVQTGGGGAGGAVFVSSPVTITAGIYTVTVGTGGGINTNGTNSTFLSYTGVGGGGGGNWINGAGKTGGCGGGGSGEGGSGAAGSQGFGGANGRGQFTCGGGGGGMGQAGKQPADGSPSSGGNGLQYSITGSSVYYAGGGAGGYNGASTGGLGGGGDKTLQGTDGLGGGGGSGARGGNGVVILSFVFL